MSDNMLRILLIGAPGTGKYSVMDVFAGRLPEGSEENVSCTVGSVTLEKLDFPFIDSAGSAGLKEKIDAILPRGAGKAAYDEIIVMIDSSRDDLGKEAEAAMSCLAGRTGGAGLVFALSQADLGMNGRYWDTLKSRPEPKLVSCLKEKAGIVDALAEKAGLGSHHTVFFSAGGREEVKSQRLPYNIGLLMDAMLEELPEEKQKVFLESAGAVHQTWKKMYLSGEKWGGIFSSAFGEKAEKAGRKFGLAAGRVSEIAGRIIHG